MIHLSQALRVLSVGALLTACAGDRADDGSRGAQPAQAAGGGARQTAEASEINPRLLRRFAPVASQGEESAPAPPERVKLGQMLFFEARLSRSHEVSCNTCHALDKYGVDGLPTSVGHKGQTGNRNAPSVLNAVGHLSQFWDGRAANLEEQAKGPITNPIEMANDEKRVVATLKSMPTYVEAFARAFPEGEGDVTFDNVAKAISAFERKLVTKSRWDTYLAGDTKALTSDEKEGLRVFLNVGCVSCHTGPQVGASMYQRVGAVEPWPNQSDQGRFAVTKQGTDQMVFKVPSLRNIEKTAPYFHDGSAATLEQAVKMMGRHQLGLELTPMEVRSMIAWMRSLTGDLPPAELVRKPELPESTPETPKAEAD
jgi:cytochrome c peroxidase